MVTTKDSISRQSIFEKASAKLRQDFDELYSVPHSALKGAEAEKILRSFLNNHLPKRFSAGSGFIIDPRDKISRQTDVVVYDAINCPVYRASEEAAIFPSTNVAAVVEVKSKLNKNELISAFNNIQETKSLAKYKPPRTPFLINCQTMGCLFAFDSSISLEKASDHYFDLIRKHGIGRHIDLIVVLDKGLIMLSANINEQPGWNPLVVEEMPEGPHAEGMHIAVSISKFGQDSLDSFLRFLLAHLSFFHQRMEHPGFNWEKTASKGQAILRYLTTITNEKDPQLRELKLKQYAEVVQKQFAKSPYPNVDNR
jgi:hypothetical protein